MLMLFNKFLIIFGFLVVLRNFIKIYIEKDEQ